MTNNGTALQGAEFEAANNLAAEWRRLQMTAVVDDDYPYVRSGYEGAVNNFLKAARANGRRTPLYVTEALNHVQPVIDGMTLELVEATAKWPAFNSAHEAFSVLAEEVDELWDHVKINQKRRDLAAMRKEALQVAAMALRFALDVCDETRGRK